MVDLKKKKSRQNFGKFFENPPPPRENPRSAPGRQNEKETGDCNDDKRMLLMDNTSHVFTKSFSEIARKIIQTKKCPNDADLCDLMPDDAFNTTKRGRLPWKFNRHFKPFNVNLTVTDLVDRIWSHLQDERDFCEDNDCSQLEMSCHMHNTFWLNFIAGAAAATSEALAKCVWTLKLCEVPSIDYDYFW